MTIVNLEEIARSVDPANAEYIMNDFDVSSAYSRYASLLEKGDVEMADFYLNRARKYALEFNDRRLTPANAKVGDGATVNLYSDRYAGTIIKVTKCTVTIRRDKAILDPTFKPEFVTGGFSAHCTNQNEQRYTYEPDENGSVYTIHWSNKYNRYGTPGNLTASKGRHEFYDYNF